MNIRKMCQHGKLRFQSNTKQFSVGSLLSFDYHVIGDLVHGSVNDILST